MSQSSDGPAKVAGATYTRAGQDYFQKRTLKRAAGVWGLWGLAVAAVISGDFSGWNFGIAFAGFGGMLIAFVGLVSLADGLLGWGGGLVGVNGLSLERILGWVLAPLTWLMGVPWSDAPAVASLIGVKTVLNEFVAYLQLASTLSGPTTLQPRSIVIASYALCGFANFGSLAIMIGGIGGLAPERRGEVVQLGLRSIAAGTLASFSTACVAGMLL